MMTKAVIYTVVSFLIGLGIAVTTSEPPETAGPGGFLDGVWHGTTLWLNSIRWVFSGETRLYEENWGFWYAFGYLSTVLVYIDLISEVFGSAARRTVLGERTDSDQGLSLIMLVVYLFWLGLSGIFASVRLPPPSEPSGFIYFGLVANLVMFVLFVPAFLYVMKR